MQEQITKTTPSGKEVIFKPYLTARGRNRIQNIFIKDKRIKMVDGKPQVDDLTFSAEIGSRAAEELISSLVESFDGSEEKILDRILDGRPEDYDFIVEECNKIGMGNFQQPK
jgi:hypothetical protein